MTRDGPNALRIPALVSGQVRHHGVVSIDDGPAREQGL